MDEEEYKKKIDELNEKLKNPKIKKKISNFIEKVSDLLECDVEIFFNIYPEVDAYNKYMDSEEFEIPDVPTMTLGQFIDHISNEDRSYKLFIDPIYMKRGMSEISDVLTTTIDDNMIVVPISNKINEKNDEKS